MFYAQIVGDRRLDNIRQELASMKFNDASDTLIAEDFSYTLSDTLEVQDQPEHTPSDTSEVGVEPKNHVVPLRFKWSSLFKDEVDTLKDEIPPVGTSEAEDLAANVPSDVVPFNPTKGDVVLAQFTVDNSWKRAMVMSETNFLHIIKNNSLHACSHQTKTKFVLFLFPLIFILIFSCSARF